MRFKEGHEIVPGDVLVDGRGTVRTVTDRTSDGVVYWIVGALPTVAAETVEAHIGPSRGIELIDVELLGTLLVLREGNGAE